MKALTIAILAMILVGCGGGSSGGSNGGGGSGAPEPFDLEPYLDMSWAATVTSDGGSSGVYDWSTPSPNFALITGPKAASNLTGAESPGYSDALTWRADLEAYEGFGVREPSSTNSATWTFYDRYRVYRRSGGGLRVEIQRVDEDDGTDPVDGSKQPPAGGGGGFVEVEVDAPST